MPLFDPTQDFSNVCDLVETVTLRRYDTLVEITIPHALQRPLGLSTLNAGSGEIATEDARFRLAVADLDDPPRMGDVIIDSSLREWSVREAQLVVSSSCWACLCRRLD